MSWDPGLGVIALPSDAAVALARLKTDAGAVNTAVAGCSTLDAPTKAEWAQFYGYLQGFVAQTPVWFFPTGANDVLTTGYLSETILQNQRTLLAWQQRVSGKCSAPPVLDPNAAGKSLADAFAGTGTTIQWVAGAAAVVAAAYLGGKVVTLIPSARLRARSGRERERTARYALRRG